MFGKMHVIWKDNSQYRGFINLWRSFSQETMNKEDIWTNTDTLT